MAEDQKQAISKAPDLNLDAAGRDSFHSWYLSLPEDPRVVRFFDRKTCISVHGKHALMVSRSLYKSTAQVSYMGKQESGGLPGITLSYNLLPIILKELLVNNGEYAVELYESGSSTGNGSWKLVKQGSPGMWRDFEMDIGKTGDVVESPVIVAISMGYSEGTRTIGLAYINTLSHRMGSCEFADDEHFCNLETALTQLGPKEGVLPSDLEPRAENGHISTSDRARLADVLHQCGVMISHKPKMMFSVKNIYQDVSRLLKGGKEDAETHRNILDQKYAAAALAGAIQFTDVLADNASHSKFVLELYNMGKFMRIDAAAQKALNIMSSKTDAAATFSLYGLMNRCRTAMGKRLLKIWLKQPLTDINDINKRLDIVESLVEDASLRSDLNGLHLRGMPDVERLTRKLEKRIATLQDLCQLYRVSSRLPLIESVIKAYEGSHGVILVERFAVPLAEAHGAEYLSKFEELIEAAIDLDRIPDEYLISPSYDDHLKEIQDKKDAVEKDIAEAAKAAADDLGLVLDKTVKLEWHKVANQKTRCLRITAKEEKNVRKKLQSKYLELETRKDGVKFTSRKLRAAADELQHLSSQYDSKQASLVHQVVSVAATFSEVWEKVSGILAELDVLCSFADLAISAPIQYVRPKLMEPQGGKIVLKGSRHPCVEVQDGVEFIPNDAILSKGESWFQIITGPNMGGKSTYIRQVGMCVLMAQVGCFVPCSEAEIAVRDAIFARVGAGDCQMRGVSTFMAEMLETSSILKGATSSSLVIIDELGRGTSTWDGMGLAWAISEHLMENIGSATLFATHFHELTALKGTVGVKNLHVKSAIDPKAGGLTMLYQVHEGSCDQSLGIHVAEFARFPEEVISEAKKKAAEIEKHGIEPKIPSDTSDTRKRRGNSSEAIRDALLEFAGVPFDQMSDEEVKLEAAKWAQHLSVLGPSDPKKATSV